MKQALLQSLFKLVGQPTPACSSQLCELVLCSGMKPWGGHDLDDTIMAVSLLSFVPATGHLHINLARNQSLTHVRVFVLTRQLVEGGL